MRRGPEAPLPGAPDLALRAERAANVFGAELLGFEKSDTPLAGMADGDVLVIADHELTEADSADLARAGAVIVVGTTLPDAARQAIVALPSTNMAEEEGTFTNLRGRVQRYQQARAATGMSHPVWWSVGDLLTFLGDGAGHLLASEAFAALATARPEFAGMSYDTIGLKGQMMNGATEPARTTG